MPISEFVHFREIDPAVASTWQGKSILSVDIDWANDDVLEDVLDLVEEAGVKACFFVTHDTPILRRMRENKNIEFGLHPNFDPLLRGEGGAKATEILERVASCAPEARVLRSHAMTTSGRWLDLYADLGVTHLSNYLMFGDRDIHPFLQLNGLIEMPVFFADDGELYRRERGMSEFDLLIDHTTVARGCRVYNFHPIHLFLNSRNMGHYSAARSFFRDSKALRQMRHHGEGSRTWFMKLLTSYTGPNIDIESGVNR